MLKTVHAAGWRSLGGNDGIRADESNPPTSETDTMSKGLDRHKEAKKKPLKTAQEKRLAKRTKKSGATLLGSHSPNS